MKVEFAESRADAFEETMAFLIAQGATRKVVEQLRDEILEAAEELGEFPWMGREEGHLREDPERHRWIMVREHYKIIYCVDQEAEKVWITDIFDTRQHPDRMRS